VSVVEVNLRLVWDLVRELEIGERGVGYILDGQGRVVEHTARHLHDQDQSLHCRNGVEFLPDQRRATDCEARSV
jgi:hypothetical protein